MRLMKKIERASARYIISILKASNNLQGYKTNLSTYYINT